MRWAALWAVLINVSFIVEGKVTRRVHYKPQFIDEEKGEPKRRVGPRSVPLSYKPSVLPPGQTGSAPSLPTALSALLLLNQFNVLFHFRDKDGDRDPRRWGRGSLHLTLLCHHQNDIGIKTMGSVVGRFNVSFIVEGKVTRQSS